VLLVDRPGAVQSTLIRLPVAPPRGLHPAHLTNTLLGGLRKPHHRQHPRSGLHLPLPARWRSIPGGDLGRAADVTTMTPGRRWEVLSEVELLRKEPRGSRDAALHDASFRAATAPAPASSPSCASSTSRAPRRLAHLRQRSTLSP
jgi:hypothetical protein